MAAASGERPLPPRLYCYRCGNVWRTEGGRPKTCPRCGSSKWDSPVRREAVCQACGASWTRSRYDEACPACGSSGSPDILHCNQCDHEWIKRAKGLPARCPLCRSSKWNEPRQHQFTCFRCGHVWRNRAEAPERCPRCQSRMWNEPAYRLQCRRCGYRWVSRGKTSDEVRMCPSCKSRKWNEAPDIKACETCGELFISTRGNRARRCPHCVSKRGAQKSQCPFCGLRWTGPDDWMICPRCGKSRPDDGSDQALEMWAEGGRSLRYVYSDGCAYVYLWEGDVPTAAMYFRDLLSRFGVNANQAMLRFGDPAYAPSWRSLADDMHEHRDDFLEDVPYFARRLNLDESDAVVLSLHFTGMGPEALAVRLGMPIDEVRGSFDRIMAAYVDSGIVVDDSIFTEDPVSKYRRDSIILPRIRLVVRVSRLDLPTLLHFYRCLYNT